MELIFQWIDLAWALPMSLMLHKPQRLMGLGLLGSCMLMMRMMSELMISIGYPSGIMNILKNDVFTRGLIIYSVFYFLYIIMSHYSPDTKGTIFLAASISIFFGASFTFALAMVL